MTTPTVMRGRLIEARDITKSFGQTPALRGASVAVAGGEILAIMGPSGSGKSTLLHCLAGIFTPDRGEVWFDGSRLDTMSEADRTALWTAAIAKAKEMWGDKWGLAYNGNASRTQCHAHIHIGKLLDGIETDNFVVVAGPAQIPVPRDGMGLWVHPVEGGKLHVHLGEQICETVLLR